MTPEDIDRTLARIFPGDPVPDEQDDDIVWVQNEYRARAPRPTMADLRLTSAPPPKPAKKPPSSRLASDRTLPPVVEVNLPVAPLPTTKFYLLVSTQNAQLWLKEAEQIEHDLTVGSPTDCHQITRLLLEAIPVVRQLVERP